MPSSPSLRWRVPHAHARRVLAAMFGASILLLLSAAPVSARPDGGSPSANHGAGHSPPGQAVAEAHRPAHAGPPAHATASTSETPAAGLAQPAPSAAPVAAQPEPGPAPAAPVTAPPEPAIPVAPAVEPGPSAEALPASPVPAPVAAGPILATAPEPAGPILATAPEPAEPAASPAPPGPATAPGFPRAFPGRSDAAAEAARSFTALGLLVGLMTLFLVAQGRFTRSDARFLEARVESEERVFR